MRSEVLIYWASLMGLSVTNTARYADGWLPIFFMPEKFRDVWGEELDKGLAKRDPSLGPLSINAGGMLAIDDSLTGDAQKAVLDHARLNAALYIGGMGARDKNFCNTIAKRYGFVDEATEVQNLYLDGQKDAPRRRPGRVAGEVQPGGPGRLHQGAARRLQRGRGQHAVGQPGRS
ncbi:MAG: hypothetical protein R2710_20790 [Acidimicrobiales bacterium]